MNIQALSNQTIEVQSFFDSTNPRQWKPITPEQFERVIALTDNHLAQAVERLRAGEVIASALGTFHIRLRPVITESECTDCDGQGYDPRRDGYQPCPICQGWRYTRRPVVENVSPENT